MFTGFHEKCAWRVSLFSLESQQFSPHASRSHYLISESLQIILKICHFPGRSIKTIQLTLRARNNCFVRYAICSLLIKNVLQMSRFLVWNIFFPARASRSHYLNSEKPSFLQVPFDSGKCILFYEFPQNSP